MTSFKRTREDGFKTGSFEFCSLLCLASMCGLFFGGLVFGGEQHGVDVPTSGLRAALDPPSSVKPALSPITMEARGDIYMARKMYREAIDAYRECPPSPGIDNKIGIAFHQMLQLALSKKYYELAIKKDRNFAESINNLGTVYYSAGSYRRAIIYFKRSLKCSGPVASVYANLGAAYFGRRDYKLSSMYYEQALALDADVLERRGRFGTRIQDCNVTDVALFHLYLAKTYAKAGSNERALGYLRKALEEGLKNRKKLAEMPEFKALRTKPEFLDLLAADPKPL